MEQVEAAVRLKFRSEVIRELVNASELAEEVANRKINQDYESFRQRFTWDVNLESIELECLLKKSAKPKQWIRLLGVFR